MQRVSNLLCVKCGRQIPIELPFDEKIDVECVCGTRFQGERDLDGNGVSFNYSGESWNWNLIILLLGFFAFGFLAGIIVMFMLKT